MIKAGDHVQATKKIIGSKLNVYAENLDLLTVTGIDFMPVLIVTKYNEAQKFSVRVEHVTTDLHPKHKARIEKDKKLKNGN